MKKEPFILIGGGFLPSQLLYTIPFAVKFGEAQGVYRVKIETSSRGFQLIQSTPWICELLGEKKIDFLSDEGRFGKLIKGSKWLLGNLWVVKFLTSKNLRRNLLEKDDWYRTQIKHSLFDTLLVSGQDGQVSYSYSRVIRCAFGVSYQARNAKELIDSGCFALITGHMVYTARARVAEFRKHGLPVISHAGYHFCRQPDNYDRSFVVPKASDWERIEVLVSDVEVKQFWKERAAGKSHYEDAANAALGFNSLEDREVPDSVLMLHVFRDSPFGCIDTKRIFSDFYEWFIESLKILKHSSQRWLIKGHPSAKRWGEDQSPWIERAFKEAGISMNDSRFAIDFSELPNLEVFSQAKRIVTYHGTAHLEAAAFGKKAIAIGRTTLSCFSDKLVNTPNNRSDYAEMILADPSDERFFLSNAQIQRARKILYLVEEVSKFRSEGSGIQVYRGDSQDKRREDVLVAIEKVGANLDYFRSLGEGFARSDVDHSFREREFVKLQKNNFEK